MTEPRVDEPAPPAGPARPRRRRRTADLALRFGLPLVLPAIVLTAWQLAGSKGLIADGLFPSATDSLKALADFVFGTGDSPTPHSGSWLTSVAVSAERILSGFAIGAGLGVLLGLLGGFFKNVRRAIDPSINAIRPISITAWIPLALIIFGIGNAPAIFLTGLATFFPVYINTLVGAAYAEARLMRAAEMLGATRVQILFRVALPATVPSIAAGLRVALALAWTSVVVAEILGAKSGLGYVLIDSYNQFRFDYVIACMVSLGALGVLSDRLLILLFKRPLRWVEQGARG